MSAGRTFWRAKDADWWTREWIVVLGEEFGAAGPSVIDYLECQAKKQNDGGLVKAGPRSIARGCFVDVVTVGHVLSRAVELGLLTDYEESAGRFTCRIYWWKADQERALAAHRKAKQRAEAPIGPGDAPPLSRPVPSGHGESRPVPECPPTGQDRTGEENDKNINAELRSAVLEIFGYWQERCGHQQAHPSDDRLSKIKARLVERRRFRGGDLHLAILDCRQAVDGAAVAAYVDDTGKRHDGIELIFRNNEKLEDFMARATRQPGGRVVPIKANTSDLLRALDGGAA